MPQFTKGFYPEIKPNQEYRLEVSKTHTLAISEYGNEKGIPIAVCHGGPGAGAPAFYARYFDPAIYRIVLFDQRGAGDSTPKGCMEENTTQDLIEDMEKIRKKLNIDKWALLGGSWGTTLALLYAEAYPQRVLGLVLRGVFLARKQDTYTFLEDGCPAAKLHSKDWQTFKNTTKKLLSEAKLECVEKELGSAQYVIDTYYTLLTQTSNEIRTKAAAAFALWEKANSYLKPAKEDLDWCMSPDGVNMGITEITYMKNDWFIKENEILNKIKTIENIPTYIVQGAYDLVCPPYQADELEKHLKNVTRHDPISGHSTMEPETINCLVAATDDLGQRLHKTLSTDNKTSASQVDSSALESRWQELRKSIRVVDDEKSTQATNLVVNQKVGVITPTMTPKS